MKIEEMSNEELLAQVLGPDVSFQGHFAKTHRAELLRRLAASQPGEPGKARCPSGRSWLELNFEWDKSGRGYIDREKGQLYTIDMVLDAFAAQFFGPSAPQPQRVVGEFCPTCKSRYLGAEMRGLLSPVCPCGSNTFSGIMLAAQTVAADHLTDTSKEISKNGQDGESANLKVEEICGKLYSQLAYVNMPMEHWLKEALAILGPFFTQVSQPPTEALKALRADLGEIECASYEQARKINAAMDKFEKALAAPVTPVRGNGTDPVAQCRFCKQFGCQGQCLSMAGAASHNGQGWEAKLRNLVAAKEPNGYPLWFNRAVHACKECDSEDLCRMHLEMAERDFTGCAEFISQFIAALPAPPSEANRPQEGK